MPPEWKQISIVAMPNWETRVQLVKSKPVTKRASQQLMKKGIAVSPAQIASSLRTQTTDQTNFVKIYYSTSGSTRAIKIVNTLTETFVEYDRKNNRSSLSNAERSLDNQFKDVQNELKSLENKISSFKKNNKIHSPDVQLRGNLDSLYDLNDKKIDLSSQRENINIQLRRYQNMLQRQQNLPDTSFLNLDEKFIKNITEQLTNKRTSLATLSQEYGPKHPKIIRTQNTIEELEKELKETVGKHLKNEPLIENQKLQQKIINLTFKKQKLRTQREAIDKRQERIKQNIEEISGGQSQLAEYKRRLDFIRKRYTQLQEKLGQVRFNQSLLEDTSEVVELAESTNVKYATTYRTYGFVVLIAFLFGMTTGGFLEYINNKIETRFDVHRYLDLPVLGTIPYVEEEMELKKLPGKNPLTERYHTLSVRLQYSIVKEKDLQTVLLASSVRGEGKSITLMNLGVTLAREGEKVLLIDLDLRDPILHHKFDLMNSEGVSTILSGEALAQQEIESMANGDRTDRGAVLESMVSPSGINGLDVLPSGPIPSNPVQLVKSEYFDQLIDIAKDQYSIILLDSPPLSSVVDSVVMARKTEGVLFIVRSGFVAKGQAQHTTHLLEDTGANIMGVVLNSVDRTAESYYTYYRQTASLESIDNV